MSDFRLFCNETWYQHKDEILLWTGSQPDYDAQYYFGKHRWLLKAMFKESNPICFLFLFLLFTNATHYNACPN